jgi:hypothetical protein
MNSKIEDIIEKFDKEFRTRCRVCGCYGVNTYGECKCSYELSNEIIEKPKKIKDFLKSSLIEYGEAIRQEIVASPENSANRIIQAVAEERKSLLEKVEKMKETGYTNNPRYNIALESVKELLK